MTARGDVGGLALFRRTIGTLVTVLAVGSTVSAVTLALAAPPQTTRLDGETVRWVLALAVFALGAVGPLACLAVPRVRASGHALLVVVAGAALMAHAVSLNGLVRTPIQGTSSTVALAAAFAVVLLTIAALADQREGRSSTSKLRR